MWIQVERASEVEQFPTASGLARVTVLPSTHRRMVDAESEHRVLTRADVAQV